MAKKNTTKPQTFIEINGKRYDVAGGKAKPGGMQLISDVAPAASAPVIDLVPRREPVTIAPIAKHKVMDIRAVQHLKPHQAEHAKTLMRSTVTKPATGLKQKLKATTRTDILAKAPKDISVLPKISFTHVDPKRQARAKHIVQSGLIHHFGDEAELPAVEASPQARAHVKVEAEIHARSMDIFEQALERADAHTEKPVNHKKMIRKAHKQAERSARRAKHRPLHHRTASLVAASLAVLLLTGFVTFQNRDSITLRYASAKAGFHANLPGYKPQGFALGRFSYKTGNISMAYHNPSSNQSFTLIQQPSNWDSQTLLDNVVATSGKTYQTLQTQGQTIYIYNDNDAAWVNAGVLYKLDSQANLSTSQVLDLASSI